MYNCKDFCIDSKKTVRDALEMINSKPQKIVFAVDDDKCLVASLTDGDVRRFLLKGGNINDSLLLAANMNPQSASSVSEAERIFEKEAFIAIPILGNNNTVIEIFCDNKFDQISRPQINVPVVVNAGGKGTRLDPYTRVLPKPLIPVGEKTIMEHIISEFNVYGCKAIHVIVNYKKQILKAYFNENELKYNIEWHDEENPLGTGGGLSLLKESINETFFFTNCDILIKSDYSKMLSFHKKENNVITMVCAQKRIVVPYGVINVNDTNEITSMTEKPELTYLVNTGMYIVEPEVINEMETNVRIDFPDVVEKVRTAGGKVAAYIVDEDEWMDMGQLPELEQMRKKLYGN